MGKLDVEGLEKFSLKSLSVGDKFLLLRELGFETDGLYVLNKEGEQIQDKYMGIPVKVDNMLILPGSTLILDDNELSVAMYLQEYSDAFS